MLPMDEYSRRCATELSSSAGAPRRPFHRPQDAVAGHPKRRPGAQTAIAPPRWLTWAGSERARAPASPPEAAAICSGHYGMLIAAISSCRRSGRRSACAERAHQELCQKFQKEVLREDSGSGMMSRKGMHGPVMRALSGAALWGLN